MMKYALFVLLLLSACSIPARKAVMPTTEVSITPTVVATPEKTPSSQGLFWDKSPDAIVIQYDEFGGLMDTGHGAHVPVWMLYGDGLVVFTKSGPPTIGFDRQVWVGHLDEATMQELLDFIEKEKFLSLQAEYKAPAFSPKKSNGDSPPVLAPNSQGGSDLPTGVIIVNLSGQSHQVSVYPANWDEAPDAYKDVRAKLLALHPPDAKLFVPTTFHLDAVPITADVASEFPSWPFEDVELSQGVDVTSEQAQAIHIFLKERGNLVEAHGQVYKVDLLASPPR